MESVHVGPLMGSDSVTNYVFQHTPDNNLCVAVLQRPLHSVMAADQAMSMNIETTTMLKQTSVNTGSGIGACANSPTLLYSVSLYVFANSAQRQLRCSWLASESRVDIWLKHHRLNNIWRNILTLVACQMSKTFRYSKNPACLSGNVLENMTSSKRRH